MVLFLDSPTYVRRGCDAFLRFRVACSATFKNQQTPCGTLDGELFFIIGLYLVTSVARLAFAAVVGGLGAEDFAPGRRIVPNK
jgi:hypothetical protein